MTEKSYQVTVGDETVTVQTEAETQTEIREAAIHELNGQGKVHIDEVQVYDCIARFSGCMYHVEGLGQADARENLEKFLGRLKQEAKDDVAFGSPAGDLIADLNTAVTVEGESDSEAEINLNGERTDRY